MNITSEIRTGYRNGWLLFILAVLFIIIFFCLIYFLNSPGQVLTWEMGEQEFVPASSEYGDNYQVDPDPGYQPETGENQ